MARKLSLTRPELRRQREALARFERYLPMLKLKQQQLQLTIHQVEAERAQAEQALSEAAKRFDAYKNSLADVAGVNVPALAEPEEVKTTTTNVAGVNIPVFQDVVFSQPSYSLFATPAWVDRALADLRDRNRCQAKVEVIQKQHELLSKELTKIIQRVNLFEKVKIPEAGEIIRRIRIKLGDEMAASVARAKLAKAKLAETATSFRGAKQEPAEAGSPAGPAS